MAPPHTMLSSRRPDAGRVSSRVKKNQYRVEKLKVTQDKKTLRSVFSFRTEPPPGYTFIPAGNPDLTQALKDVAREGNHEIYAVTTTPHAKVHDLSKEVHRVGFHFPSTVVAQVCAYYGISLTRQGTIIEDEGEAPVQNLRNRNAGRTGNNRKNDKDQVALNTQARDSIKDLFPNIPDEDLYRIIKTAFQKGDGRVGTAGELSLIRRAQLSVVAHIRHVYTNYDRLLRTVGYHDARGKVEGPTLKKLVEWRGDDEKGNKAIEEVMKDVVVITDDEDSDEDTEDATRLDEQDLQVQKIPYITNGTRPEQRPEVEYNHQSEDETMGGYSFIPLPRRRRKLVDDQYIDENQYRRAAWDRARQEYRAHPASLQPIVILDNPDDRQLREHVLQKFNEPVAHLRHGLPPPPPPSSQVRFREVDQFPLQAHNAPAFVYVRGEDGLIYKRTESRQPNMDLGNAYSRRAMSPIFLDRNGRAHEPFEDQPRVIRDPGQLPRTGSPRLHEDQETVVQSIEGPQMSPGGFRRSFPGHFPSSQNGGRMPGPSGGRRDFIDLSDSSPQQPKRRKLDELDEPRRDGKDDFDQHFQGPRLRAVENVDGPSDHDNSRIVRTHRIEAELPPRRIIRREFVDDAYEPATTILSRPANRATERDLPSTPLSTAYRPVEISSAPSHFPAFHDSVPVRVQRLPQSFRPVSPSRASFTPLHAADAQIVRHSYVSKDREPIELVSDNRARYDQRHVVHVRSYPAERAEMYDRQIRDDQALRPQNRQLVELVPISRTMSQDSRLIRQRREYVPAYDPPGALLTRQPLDHSLPAERDENDYVRVPTIASGDRRYDRPLQQTYVQN